MEPVLERGHDAEAAAASAKRPEELLVLGLARGEHVSVRGDDLERDEVVRGQPVLAAEPADPAREREPGDARLRDDAERSREAVLLRCGVELAERDAAAGSGRARGGIDLDRLQLAEIEHEPAVGERVAGDAVAASAHRDGEPLLARETDRDRDVLGARDADDAGRAPIDHPVPERARLVVARASGRQHVAAHVGAQSLEPDHVEISRHGRRDHLMRATGVNHRRGSRGRCRSCPLPPPACRAGSP